jgi:hypothetical protein
MTKKPIYQRLLMLFIMFLLTSSIMMAQGPPPPGDDVNDEAVPINTLVILGLAIGGYLGIKQFKD